MNEATILRYQAELAAARLRRQANLAAGKPSTVALMAYKTR